MVCRADSTSRSMRCRSSSSSASSRRLNLSTSTSASVMIEATNAKCLTDQSGSLLSGSSSPSDELPELALVQQRDPMTLLAQPLDLHQLQPGITARGLQRIRPSADDDRRPH